MCSKCREIQVRTGQEPIQACIGEGCARPPGKDSDRRRICLWCHLPLVARPSMDQWREGYVERHALSEYSRRGGLNGGGEMGEEEMEGEEEGEGEGEGGRGEDEEDGDAVMQMEIDDPR